MLTGWNTINIVNTPGLTVYRFKCVEDITSKQSRRLQRGTENIVRGIAHDAWFACTTPFTFAVSGRPGNGGTPP